MFDNLPQDISMEDRIFFTHVEAAITHRGRGELIALAEQCYSHILAENAVVRGQEDPSLIELTLSEKFAKAAYRTRLQEMNNGELKLEMEAIAVRWRSSHNANMETMKARIVGHYQ